jgi:hypothetical protein
MRKENISERNKERKERKVQKGEKNKAERRREIRVAGGKRRTLSKIKGRQQAKIMKITKTYAKLKEEGQGEDKGRPELKETAENPNKKHRGRKI